MLLYIIFFFLSGTFMYLLWAMLPELNVSYRSLVCLCCYVFSPGLTQYIFHTPMARYSLYVLQVPLNTKQTSSSCLCSSVSVDTAGRRGCAVRLIRCHSDRRPSSSDL